MLLTLPILIPHRAASRTRSISGYCARVGFRRRAKHYQHPKSVFRSAFRCRRARFQVSTPLLVLQPSGSKRSTGQRTANPPPGPFTEPFDNRSFRQLALRLACTVRTWHPKLVRREPFAPRCWFSPTADQCAGACLLTIPVEARFSMRPFALQHRGLASRPIPRTASTFPAYTFKAILRLGPARSAPHSRPRLAFYGLAGHDQRTVPVARPDLRTHDSSSDLGSPPGSLDPSGSTPTPDVRTTKLTLAGCPIFLRSP